MTEDSCYDITLDDFNDINIDKNIRDPNKKFIASEDGCEEGTDDEIDIDIEVTGDSFVESNLKLEYENEIENEKSFMTILRKEVLSRIFMNSREDINKIKTLLSCRDTFEENVMLSSLDLLKVDNMFSLLPRIIAVLEIFLEKIDYDLKNWSKNSSVAEAYNGILFNMPAFYEYRYKLPMVLNILNHYEGIETSDTTMQRVMPGLVPKFTELLKYPIITQYRILYGLKELCKYTSCDHHEYYILKEILLSIRKTPVSITSKTRMIHLIKAGYVLQLDKNKRKLRFLFLFPRNLFVTKLTMKSNEIFYQIKDIIRLGKCMVLLNTGYEYNEDIAHSYMKVKEALSKYRKYLIEPHQCEQCTYLPLIWRKDYIIRHIFKLEATLAFLGARLKLSILTTVDGKQFNFLFFSRVEFQTWIDLIENDEDSYTDLIAYKNFIKNYEGIQRIENLHRIGNLLPYRDGTLHVYVHQLMGINSNSEVFLALQVDCFGGFFTKMYSSKISRMNKDPIFNEKFELNLNCSQALNINIYRRNPLTHQEFQFFAIGTFELHGADLSENYTLVCVPMIPSETRLYLVMSLKIISEEFNELQKRNFDYSCQNIQRISRMRGKVFGEDIQVVIRREGENVPLVVSSCIKEIEARGLDSSFIYVMQGNESRVNELITVFDMCSITGSHYIKQALYTPYDLAGVVLHYLRALPFSILPHPNSYLETDEVNTAEKILKVDFLLKSAPEPGRTLFHYLLDHMCRVCSHEPQNRMSSAIMAGIFSPVILDSGVSLTPVKQNNFSNVLRCIIDLMLAGYKLDGTDKI